MRVPPTGKAMAEGNGLQGIYPQSRERHQHNCLHGNQQHKEHECD